MENLKPLLNQYINIKKACKTNKFMKIVSLNYEFIFDNMIQSKYKLISELKDLKKNLIILKQTLKDKNHKNHLDYQIKEIKQVINNQNNIIDAIKKILAKYNEKKSISNKA